MKPVAKDLKISFLLDFYGSMLTEKQREVIEFYYNDDLSLAEIAENEGITRQGVRDAIKRAEAQLLEMEECLGFAKRSLELRKSLAEIAADAGRIEEFNSRFGGPREVEESAKRILAAAKKLTEQ